jgi:hypothetical protein
MIPSKNLLEILHFKELKKVQAHNLSINCFEKYVPNALNLVEKLKNEFY